MLAHPQIKLFLRKSYTALRYDVPQAGAVQRRSRGTDEAVSVGVARGNTVSDFNLAPSPYELSQVSEVYIVLLARSGYGNVSASL